MNGSTDVRSDQNSSSSTAKVSSKTDTPLPLATPISEVGGSAQTADRQSVADRIISGIDLLDYGVGGLLPHRVYLVRGGASMGKSILGLQFLTRGLEHQEPGILITDQKPKNVEQQAHAIGFAIGESIRRGQLVILNPSQRYFELVESPADVMAIVEELGDVIKKVGAKRLVIDPVYTLINTSYSSHFAVSITQSLLNALEDLPVTTLLISADEDNPELNPILRNLEQNVCGVISMNANDSGGRTMRLSKCRYASNEDLQAPYRILNGRGVINYSAEEGEKVADVTKPWEETATATRSVLLLGAGPETIRHVREALGEHYNVQAESDLQEGIERVKREKPGLVLVTPSRSLGAIAAILDLARNSTSSIAFLSPANNRHADKVLYLRAGADDFISEPFNAEELRARVDALIRRSGRRLTFRDSTIDSITPEQIAALMNTASDTQKTKGPVIKAGGSDQVTFEPEFNERLQRNVETVSKFDQPFAVYWIKASDDDRELNKSLAGLCRQEDIVCLNRGGEFVAILNGTDENGVRGFENRLNQKLGGRADIQRGYSLHGERASGPQ